MWNVGETSLFSYNTTITNVGGQTVITRTGTIAEGRFDGDAAVMVNAGPQLGLLDCLRSGIQSRLGSSTSEITSPR